MSVRHENMEAVSIATPHCEVIRAATRPAAAAERLTGPQQPMNELQLSDVTRQHDIRNMSQVPDDVIKVLNRKLCVFSAHQHQLRLPPLHPRCRQSCHQGKHTTTTTHFIFLEKTPL